MVFSACFSMDFWASSMGDSKGKGKNAVRYAVDNGMLFSPFTLMLLIAVFYLEWTMTIPSFPQGSWPGTASSIEMNKMLDKPGLINTIATAGVSFAFSLLWTLSFSYLNRAPSYLEAESTWCVLL